MLLIAVYYTFNIEDSKSMIDSLLIQWLIYIDSLLSPEDSKSNTDIHPKNGAKN